MADSPQQLPLGSDVPLSLDAGGGVVFDVGVPGTLSVQLQGGDVGVSLRSDDGSSTTQSSLSGSGKATLSVSNSSAQVYNLLLTSDGGAQLKLRFDPGNAAVGANTASSTSSTVVSVSHSVSVISGQ